MNLVELDRRLLRRRAVARPALIQRGRVPGVVGYAVGCRLMVSP